ncbi:MAG: dipeptidase [Lachnospiraceae bacterium]
MKIIDLHCDTLLALREQQREYGDFSIVESGGHLDIKRMREQGYLMQCFAAFVDLEEGDPFDRATELMDLYDSMLARHQDCMAPVYCYDDLVQNRKGGKLSTLLTIEEGAALKGSVECLEHFYNRGVRMITLTWNYANEIGYPSCRKDCTLGITTRGFEIIEAMQEKGVIVDVSHLSDAGFYDVCKVSKKPFIASHSNARSLCGHTRNLTDDQIRRIAESGGVIGLNYCDDFLNNRPDQISLTDFVRHACHIIHVGGEEVLSLGSDFDGITTNPALPHVGSLADLFDAFEAGGISLSTIEKIKGANALRVMRDIL